MSQIVPDLAKEGTIDFCKFSAKKKPEWHKNHLRLFGGSLFYYKNNKTETKPFLVLHLNDCKLEENLIHVDKVPNFSLEYPLKTFYISTGTQEEVTEWLKILREHARKEPMVFGLKEGTLMDRAKKNLTGKVSSSTLGKSVMKKKMVDKPSRQGIKAVKHMIAVQTGSKTLADNTEKNVIKLSAKSYFLWEKNLISIRNLEPLEEISRKTVKTLYVVYLNIDKVTDVKSKDEILRDKVAFISACCKQLAEELREMLKPHLTEKSLLMINGVLDIIAAENFMVGVFQNEKLKDDVSKVMDIAKNVLGWEAAQCDNLGLLFDSKYSFRGTNCVK